MTRTSIGKRVRVNFYYDEPVFDALKKIAIFKGTTYSELIRVATREYIVREAAKAQAGAQVIEELTK